MLALIVSVLAVTGSLGATVSPSPAGVCATVPAWSLSVLAQADAADGGEIPIADAAKGAKPEPSFIQRFLANPLLLPISLFAIFYVTWIAPERRKKAEEAQLMSSLTKNDRVITVGGIHGVIVSANPDKDFVTLKIDESGNTRIKVSRSAIASVTDSKAKRSGGTDGDSASTATKSDPKSDD